MKTGTKGVEMEATSSVNLKQEQETGIVNLEQEEETGIDDEDDPIQAFLKVEMNDEK